VVSSSIGSYEIINNMKPSTSSTTNMTLNVSPTKNIVENFENISQSIVNIRENFEKIIDPIKPKMCSESMNLLKDLVILFGIVIFFVMVYIIMHKIGKND
jgi:hypothetical protein